MSSSQLTNSYFSEGFSQPPTSNIDLQVIGGWKRIFLPEWKILRVYVTTGDGNNSLNVRCNVFKVLEIYRHATNSY